MQQDRTGQALLLGCQVTKCCISAYEKRLACFEACSAKLVSSWRTVKATMMVTAISSSRGLGRPSSPRCEKTSIFDDLSGMAPALHPCLRASLVTLHRLEHLSVAQYHASASIPGDL